MIYIYGLFDIHGQIRYVGQSYDPWNRLTQHWRNRRKGKRESGYHSPKKKWLRMLSRPPEMSVLAIVEYEEADRIERMAIRAAMAEFGPELILNERRLSGGWSTECKARRDVAFKDDPGFKAKMSAQAKAQWTDPEFCAKKAVSNRAQMIAFNADAEFKEKRRAANSARMTRMNSDPEFRALQDAAKARRRDASQQTAG